MSKLNGQSHNASDDDPQAVPLEIRRALVQADIQMWRNTLYQNQLRYRVQTKLKTFSDTTEVTKTLETEMMKCEAAIEELELVLKELDLEGSPHEQEKEEV